MSCVYTRQWFYRPTLAICNLGDTLDGDGGADISATVRIRNGWMIFEHIIGSCWLMLG